MTFKIISFYRYVEIESPFELRDLIRFECAKLNILGRILIGKEGINGAVSAKIESIIIFKTILQTYFPDLTFREQVYNQNAYHKLVVRVRKEICFFGQKTSIQNVGNHIKPSQLKKFYDNNDDFVIVDARNDYEYDVGRFKNAIKLPIKNFREFPRATKNLEKYKDKKLILYCTGGVRCEKASAYMKEHGFKDVNQLEGGIINYVNTVDNNQEWKGGLFVFDDRLVSNLCTSISNCQYCNLNSNQYTNCHNIECDQLFIACSDCLKKYNFSCSATCMGSKKRRKEILPSRELIGIVENFYANHNVALIRLNCKLNLGKMIYFSGKTTNFPQGITSIKFHQDDLVTISVTNKVRKNDKVLI